jgi:hypothetical protein
MSAVSAQAGTDSSTPSVGLSASADSPIHPLLLPQSASRLWLGSAIVAMALVFTTDLFVPPGVALCMFYLAPILLALRSESQRAVLTLAWLTSGLSTLGLALSPPGGVLWIGVINRIICITVVWTTVGSEIWRRRLESQHTAALMARNAALEEVRVLRGLVPICAWCKRIRDDRGYWNRLEQYIAEHSEAEFTHGICPDCHSRMYPERGCLPQRRGAPCDEDQV